MQTINCPCGTVVLVKDYLVGRKKYCSKKCFYLYKKRPSGLKYKIVAINKGWFDKGHVSWSKTVAGTGLLKANSGSIKKGERRSVKTEFARERVLGDKNNKWKGDDVGYAGLHTWVYRTLGKAVRCVDCSSVDNVEWANISKKYKRDACDWKQLCAVCHRKFDGFTKLEKEDARDIRERYKNGEKQADIAAEFDVDQSTISNIIRGKQKYYA